MDQYVRVPLTSEECISLTDALETWWEYCDRRWASAPDERRGAVWERRREAAAELLIIMDDAVGLALELEDPGRPFTVARDLARRSPESYRREFAAPAEALHAPVVEA